MRTFSYRPRKTRLGGAAVLAMAIAALLAGLFLLTDGVSADRGRAGKHGGAGRASTSAAASAAAQVRIEIGRDYPAELSMHCGTVVTEFGGRRWKAERPASGAGTGMGTGTGTGNGKGADRAGGGAPRAKVTPGVMRLLDVDTLRFTATDTGQVVLFRPTSEPAPVCA